MNIVVTGAKGFLGYHFLCHCFNNQEIVVHSFDHQKFNDSEALIEKLKIADVVVHLAGINRGSDSDVYEGNLKITQLLVAALEESSACPHIIFSSSTHIFKNTLYGKAKKECHQILKKWSDKKKTTLTTLVLPHVFGEYSKPNYNSAIATFCANLAEGKESVIQTDIELDLIHASDVVQKIFSSIENKINNEIQMSGTKIFVSAVLEKLQAFNQSYRQMQIPKFESAFDLQLFNTYRSFLYPAFYPVSLQLHTDSRGSLFEAVKTEHGGQGFLSTTYPGITRGNHYHHFKIERFCVVSGEARIRIRKLLTDEVQEFNVTGDKPCFVDMPTLHTHNITNTGKTELLTLFWSHAIFDKNNPDQYNEVVEVKK